MPEAPASAESPAIPIFDAVMAEQGHEVMPPPPMRTHEQFMADHDHGEYLSRADAILRGTLDPKKTPYKPMSKALVLKDTVPSVPVKKPKK